MLTVLPGATFEASTSGWSTGLVGTIGVRVLDQVGGTPIARTTAGIAELVAGSGIYGVTLTAPAAGGQYAIVWDDGSGGFSEPEDLLVTSAAIAPVGGGLSARALCSIEDAQAKAPAAASSSGGDPDEWTRLVNAASDAFLNLCGREIRAESAGTADRVFSARELIKIACEPAELELGDAAAIATVTLTHEDGSSEVLTGWTKLPLRRRYSWDPYEAIQFARLQRFLMPDTITVNATWGFPSIPDDVREAVARTAASWFARDTRRYGEVFSNAEHTAPSDPATTHVLPRFAWETAMRYRRQRFA